MAQCLPPEAACCRITTPGLLWAWAPCCPYASPFGVGVCVGDGVQGPHAEGTHRGRKARRYDGQWHCWIKWRPRPRG